MKKRKKRLLEIAPEPGYNRHGIYDRPGPNDNIEDEDILQNGPIEPVPQMATQLSGEKPPIEDPDFIPSNPDELSRAASLIAKKVPKGKIKKFYSSLMDSLDSVLNLDDVGEEEKDDLRFEESKNPYIGNLVDLLFENIDDLPHSYSPSGKGDPSGLKNIAREFGLSVSGANILVRRIVEKLKTVMGVSDDEISDAEELAAKMFRDVIEQKIIPREEKTPGVLSHTFDISADEFALIAKNPLDSDIFNSFFAISYIAPAYKKLMNKRTKNARELYIELGYPRGAFNMIVSQLRGLTGSDPRALRSKFEKAAIDSFAQTNPELKGMEEKEEAARNIYSRLISDMPEIRGKLIPASGEFLSMINIVSPVSLEDGLRSLIDSIEESL